MTRKEIEEQYKDIPEIVTSSNAMKEVNEPIPIYNGEFALEYRETKIKVTGEILFDWFPSSGARFSATVDNSTLDIMKSIQGEESYKVLIDGLNFGECLISNTTFGSTINLEGIIASEAVKGDKSVAVSKVAFSVPNLRDFLGLPVKKITDRNINVGRNRIRFENDKYIILLDKRNEYKDLNKSLQSKGGYVTLYLGEVTKKNGNISFDEKQKLFHCFSTFLSFLNGRRCSALFRQGIFDNQTIWCDYTDYLTDQYKPVTSWPQKHSIDGLNELWQKFSTMWQNEDNKDFLISAIHWYNEANSHSGFTEGAIITTQVALELIYNWLLIETQKLLIGKDADSISASNKIRLLLSQIKVSQEIPQAFTKLKALDGITDGPDAFVQIRNAIVHSQEEKRKKITKMHYKAKYEALQLGIWYVELSLLYILDFNGAYFNRCLGAKWSGNGVGIVPWVSKQNPN